MPVSGKVWVSTEPGVGHQLRLQVVNPCEMQVMMNVKITLPADAQVIQADGVTEGTNVVWQRSMDPGQMDGVAVDFVSEALRKEQGTVHVEVSLYDVVNDQWVTVPFDPPMAHREWEGRPLLIPYGFGPQGFAMGLRTGVPGVFRIERSEDLRHWVPFQTVTNATEVEGWIVDPEALQAPRRFYRAVLER